MRLLGYAALLVTVAMLTACGNDVEVELVWAWASGPRIRRASSPTAGFAAYQGNVDEHWERSAAMAAAEFRVSTSVRP